MTDTVSEGSIAVTGRNHIYARQLSRAVAAASTTKDRCVHLTYLMAQLRAMAPKHKVVDPAFVRDRFGHLRWVPPASRKACWATAVLNSRVMQRLKGDAFPDALYNRSK